MGIRNVNIELTYYYFFFNIFFYFFLWVALYHPSKPPTHKITALKIGRELHQSIKHKIGGHETMSNRITAEETNTTGKKQITATNAGTKRPLDTCVVDESGNIIGGTTPQNVTLATALDSDTDSITSVEQPAASLGHGIKNVTTAGTDVALAASTAIKYVTVQARYENTSVIAVGGSGVDATASTGTGIILESGDSIMLDVDNLADVYIDSLVNDEGVRFIYGVA
jgi:hypothetical protein